MVRDAGKARLESAYPLARKSKTLAIGPGGAFFFNVGSETAEESARRILETCGTIVGAPCMIVAVNDSFVVPVPINLRAVGFFRPDHNASIAAEARDDVARKLADAPSGWNAVAVGTAGRPGLGLKAVNEQNAIDEALGNCAKHDSACHVIAIGPFAVAQN
jgi:adenylate cyclase